jgi:hypothetical protein
MARITAWYLVEHLLAAGFVLFKKPDAAAQSSTHYDVGADQRVRRD